MHDLNHFDYGHDHDDEPDEDSDGMSLQDFIYLHDNVELTTIGVDVGSSTFHLMFAHVHLQRESRDHSSRFELVERTVLWRSEIGLTPYTGKWIDSDVIRRAVEDAHVAAGLSKEEVDSGVVILTGEALRRQNARSLAEAIAAGSGKFVCVSAGHHIESMLAAFGSGAVDYSKEHGIRLFHVDVGGGTTKLALIENGRVLATAAVMIGGRQVAVDDERRVRSISAGAKTIAKDVGIDLDLGGAFGPDEERRFVGAQAAVLSDLVRGHRSNQLERRLRLTRVLPTGFRPDAVSFSGGVSEYVYGREDRAFGDLGPSLGAAIRDAIDRGVLGLPVVDPGQGIRATVLGASQCSVQLSGSTVLVSDPAILPLHNVPVVHPDLVGRLAQTDYDPGEMASAIKDALGNYGLTLDDPLALAFEWTGDPSFTRINNFAQGVREALATESEAPAIVLIDQDIGRSIGRLLVGEHALERPVVCLDGLELSPLDFVDVGQVIQPSNALPVVIKSLLFGDSR